MVTQVRSFKTSDGALHPDKIAALDREYFLALRGLINTNGTVRATGSLDVTQIATLLKANGAAFKEIVSKFEYSIGRAKAEAAKPKTVKRVTA